MSKQRLKIDQMGVITCSIAQTEPPLKGWIDDGSGLRFLPPWQPCGFRFLNRNPLTVTITPYCLQLRQNVTTDVCRECVLNKVPEPLSPEKLALLDKEKQQRVRAIFMRSDEVPATVEPFGSRKTGKPTTPAKVRQPLVREYQVEEDGSIVYAQTDWEPPKELEGFVRDTQNPWRFQSTWPPCVYRDIQKETLQCGSLKIDMFCQCTECLLFKLRVKVPQCQACEKRKEK